MIVHRQQHSAIRSFGLGIIVVIGALIGYKVSALSFSVDALGHTFRLGSVPSVSGATVVVDANNADDMTLRRPPSVTAQQIDAILQQYNSPAVGSGKDFVELGQQYGIDPAYALAFFIHESTAGTAGVAVHTKSIGNIRCAGYATCYDGFRSYSDWRSAIEDWYKLLDTEYIPQGLTDVRTVIPVYAPSSENDVPAYINDVETLVRQWRSQQHKHGVTDSGKIGDNFYSVNDVWSFQANSMHWGTDYIGTEGDKVYAPFDLTVISLGEYGPGPTMGEYVQGTFADGYVFYAGHLEHRPQFSVGQVLPAGTVLGYMNSYAHSHIQLAPPGNVRPCANNGTCVDFEVYEKEH
jgi:murein DD-endopeptidase MepM/ murein hydrolase activator NlpD